MVMVMVIPDEHSRNNNMEVERRREREGINHKTFIHYNSKNSIESKLMVKQEERLILHSKERYATLNRMYQAYSYTEIPKPTKKNFEECPRGR